jgi:hypothetical protein
MWWPRTISSKDLWKATGQEDVNLEIRMRKCGWFWSNTEKIWWRNAKGCLKLNPQGSRKRERPKNNWRRSVIKEKGGEVELRQASATHGARAKRGTRNDFQWHAESIMISLKKIEFFKFNRSV